MDKKLRNRILYIVVAGLWSIVIYRSWQNYQIDQEMNEVQSYHTTEFTPILFNKDSFDLELPNRDPFLSVTSNREISVTSTDSKPTQPKPKVQPEIKPKTPTKWPEIQYLGFVRNREQSNPLCLLKIDGRTVQLAKGKEEYGIYISSVFVDSVHLVYQGEERTVGR